MAGTRRKNTLALPEKSASTTINDENQDTTNHVVEERSKKVKIVATSEADTAMLKLLLSEPTSSNEEEQDEKTLMVHMNKYWPYPMDIAEPQNDNLLLFAGLGPCQAEHCTLCTFFSEEHTELRPMVRLEFNLERAGVNRVEEVPVENLAESKKKFKADVMNALRSSPYFTDIVDLNKEGYGGYLYGRNEENLVRRPLPHDCADLYSQFELFFTSPTTNEQYRCRSRYFSFELFSHLIKVIKFKSNTYLYLNIEPSNMDKLASNAPLDFFNKLGYAYFDGQLNSGYIELSWKEREIPLTDTFDFAPTDQSAGFNLELFDYQKRSLSWMKTIESGSQYNILRNTVRRHEPSPQMKIKLGNSGWYADLSNNLICTSSRLLKGDEILIKGGILADDTGSGKTITCLALIHSCPLTEAGIKERLTKYDTFLPYRIPSKATCVVCPANIINQWGSEAIKCNPDFKILKISCIKEFYSFSLKDVILADLVIVSYQFLINNNYKAISKEIQNTLIEVRNHLETPGRVCLEKILFHRLIFDELHEMSHQLKACRAMAKRLRADYHWGVTGTPKFEKPEDITNIFPYLNIPTGHEEMFQQPTAHQS